MQVSLQGAVAHGVGEKARWTFTTPSSLRLVGGTIWRTGTTSGVGVNATPLIYLAAPGAAYSNQDVFEQCAAAYGCSVVGDGSFTRSGPNRIDIPGAHIRDGGSISAVAECGGNSGEACPPIGLLPKASVAIAASEVRLDDPAPPVVNASSGTLAVGGMMSGTVHTTVQASDVGAGIFGLGLEVDGKLVASARMPDTSGRCAPVDEAGGMRSYLWVEPCPPNGSATLEIDTRTIPDGQRQVTLYVEDGAGNRTHVVSASTLIKNSGVIGPGDPPELRGEPNGYPVSDHGRLTAAFVRSVPKRCSRASFRRKHRSRCNTRVQSVTRNASRSARDRLTGVLRTPDGAPIVGARVRIVLAPRRGGGSPRETATAISSATGRWSVRIRREMSGTLQVQWPARTRDTVAAALVKLNVKVRARSSFRLRPSKSVRTGRILRIEGRLVGRSGLKRGVSVVIQGRPIRSWRGVTTVRVRRDGTWSARYRVPRQLGGRYVFRALIRPTPSYPYANGKTRSRAVRVR